MKKLGCLFIVLIVFAVLLVVGAGIAGGALVKAAVETGGPMFLKVPVTLDDASLGILSGSVGMTNLKVGNPPGFTQEPAFTIGTFSVSVKPLTLLSNEIEAPELVIENMAVLLEMKGGQANLQVLAAVLKSKEGSSEGPGLRIGRLVLKGVKVRTSIMGLAKPEIALPDVELKTPGASRRKDGSAPRAPDILLDILEEIGRGIGKTGFNLDFSADALMKALPAGLGNVPQVPGEAKKKIDEFLKKLPK